MGQIVAMRFPGQSDAATAMLQLHHFVPKEASPVTSLSIALYQGQNVVVEQIVNPLSFEDFRWSMFWIGLLHAAQSDFLANDFHVEIMQQVPMLILDRLWWTEKVRIGHGFLNDVHVLLHATGGSVLMVLCEGTEAPQVYLRDLKSEIAVYQTLNVEQMRTIQKVIQRSRDVIYS